MVVPTTTLGTNDDGNHGSLSLYPPPQLSVGSSVVYLSGGTWCVVYPAEYQVD